MTKAYYEAHKEQIAKQRKAHREANKEQIAERKKAHYEAHREEVLARVRSYRETNKDEIAVHRRDRYEANKEHHKAYREARKEQRKSYNIAHRAESREYSLIRNYNLTAAEWEALYERQKGQCAICLVHMTKKNAHTDHCHITGAVRGLLCAGCNTALGKFNDNPELLLRAHDYIVGQTVKGENVHAS